MEAKNEAMQLFNKYYLLAKDFTKGVSMDDFTKECALLAVDEIIYVLKYNEMYNENVLSYWNEVKNQIKKL